MPLIVDHDQRRDEVLEIAIDLIAEGGIDSASVRAIAERAQYSTAVVSHYFHNKSELLSLAFEKTLRETQTRIDEAVARGAPAARVLEVLLPLDPRAGRSWKIWFAFWGMALSDAKHRQAQVTHGREGQDIIRHVLEQCSDIPAAAAGGRNMQAGRLLAIVGGMAALATFDPEGWPAKRQRAILVAELKALRDG